MIVSGYYGNGEWQQWFHRLWWANNFKYLHSKLTVRSFWEPRFIKHPEVYIVSNSGLPENFNGKWILLDGNLGHVDELINGKLPFYVCGGVAVQLIGAWIAYANEMDLIWLEQDCLVFGRWVRQMYKDLGDKMAVFGTGGFHHGSSTSLFLIRHEYIPIWCMDYLAEGPENCGTRIAEDKWRRLRERKPEDYSSLSFGYDKDRPFDMKQSVWYGQKFTRDELCTLGCQGLISTDGMPKDTKLFSNHE